MTGIPMRLRVESFEKAVELGPLLSLLFSVPVSLAPESTDTEAYLLFTLPQRWAPLAHLLFGFDTEATK